ncbi:hypothetical protein ACTQ49_04095 [Luteococcus sp. Sow4_B9]|uniref:hypothetical protein n=1 Tax=Luteococcus sp. Sow4_B9 TaxID=3438792 RepID=UPI003F9AD8D7
MPEPRPKSPGLVPIAITFAITWAMYANGYPILTTVVIGMITLALLMRLAAARNRFKDKD